MACMEHWCIECNYTEFNNSHGPLSCPKCGGEMRHTFDEPSDESYGYEDEYADQDSIGEFRNE